MGIRPALYHTIAISSWFHCSEKITSTESLYKYVLTLTAISLLLYRASEVKAEIASGRNFAVCIRVGRKSVGRYHVIFN